MPRKPDPANAAGQSRTARWRDGLRQKGKPEASMVDVEVAAAVAAFAAEAAVDARLEVRMLKMLMHDAVDRLVARGYDREEAKRKVRQRLGRFGFVVPGERSGVPR